MAENIRDSYEISDDELDNVSGGSSAKPVQLMNVACTECGHINTVDVMKSTYTCKGCFKIIRIDG